MFYLMLLNGWVYISFYHSILRPLLLKLQYSLVYIYYIHINDSIPSHATSMSTSTLTPIHTVRILKQQISQSKRCTCTQALCSISTSHQNTTHTMSSTYTPDMSHLTRRKNRNTARNDWGGAKLIWCRSITSTISEVWHYGRHPDG